MIIENTLDFNGRQNVSLYNRTVWYIKVRWYFISIVSVVGILGQYLDLGFSSVTVLNICTALVALAINGFFMWFTKKYRYSSEIISILAQSLLIIDLLLITMILYVQGGIESRGVILYSIPILIAGVLFGKRMTYIITCSVVVLYVGLITMDFLNIIEPIDVRSPSLHTDTAYYFATITFFPSLFILIAAVAMYLNSMLSSEEKEVRIQELHMKQAQRTARLGSWEWDTVKDRITWSDELYRIFGLDPLMSKLTYKTYLQSVAAGDRKNAEKIIQQAMKDKLPYEFIHTVKRKNDGTIRYVLSRGNIDTNKRGDVIKMHGTAQDITDLREAQIALEKRTAEIEDLNKLMIGRELRMAELKAKLEKVSKK